MPPAIRARVTVFLGIVIAVLALLATEAAATSAPAAARTVIPPFVGVLKSTSTGATTSGCGITTPISKLNWSARTGHISWGGRAASPRCSTMTVPESAVRDASLTLYIPFRVATGNHTILANFTVSALLGNSFRGGTCAAQHGWSYRYCLRQAGGFVTETTWLLDVNAPRWSVAPTNPWVGVSNSSYNFTHCWSGYGCTYSVGGGTGTVAVVEHVSSWFNVTGMRSTHLYYLAMAFTLEASASESTSYSTLRGFSGTGLVNLSQPGGGIDVTSITVL